MATSAQPGNAAMSTASKLVAALGLAMLAAALVMFMATPAEQQAPSQTVAAGAAVLEPRRLSTTSAVPLVSIIMVTYERPAFVARALSNILQQDYTNFEVLVVDDSAEDMRSGEHAAALSDSRIQYHFLPQRQSIGAKRQLAVSKAAGAIMLTWDDDDLYRSHRISAQVAPIVAGDAHLTTYAHGTYLKLGASLQFFQWFSDEDNNSPHFGTLAFSRQLLDEGITYPDVSIGEDFSLAERALDAGFVMKTLDNADGSFVYVRHSNTWLMERQLGSALNEALQPRDTPAWISDADLAFYVDQGRKLTLGLADAAPAQRPLADHIPTGLHGTHAELALRLPGRRLAEPYGGYGGYGCDADRESTAGFTARNPTTIAAALSATNSANATDVPTATLVFFLLSDPQPTNAELLDGVYSGSQPQVSLPAQPVAPGGSSFSLVDFAEDTDYMAYVIIRFDNCARIHSDSVSTPACGEPTAIELYPPTNGDDPFNTTLAIGGLQNWVTNHLGGSATDLSYDYSIMRFKFAYAVFNVDDITSGPNAAALISQTFSATPKAAGIWDFDGNDVAMDHLTALTPSVSLRIYAVVFSEFGSCTYPTAQLDFSLPYCRAPPALPTVANVTASGGNAADTTLSVFVNTSMIPRVVQGYVRVVAFNATEAASLPASPDVIDVWRDELEQVPYSVAAALIGGDSSTVVVRNLVPASDYTVFVIAKFGECYSQMYKLQLNTQLICRSNTNTPPIAATATIGSMTEATLDFSIPLADRFPAHLNPRVALIVWKTSQVAGMTFTLDNIVNGIDQVEPVLHEIIPQVGAQTTFHYDLSQLIRGTLYTVRMVLFTDHPRFPCNLLPVGAIMQTHNVAGFKYPAVMETTAGLPPVTFTPTKLSGTGTAKLWYITTGSLPMGFTLNNATGAITGSGVMFEDKTLTVCAKNDGGLWCTTVNIVVHGFICSQFKVLPALSAAPVQGSDTELAVSFNMPVDFIVGAQVQVAVRVWPTSEVSWRDVSGEEVVDGMTGVPSVFDVTTDIVASGPVGYTVSNLTPNTTYTVFYTAFSTVPGSCIVSPTSEDVLTHLAPDFSYNAVTEFEGIFLTEGPIVAASSGLGITYAVTSGSLPAGLVLDAATGAVHGSATTAGSYSVEITGSNAGGSFTATATFEIQAYSCGGQTTTPAVSVQAVAGTATNVTARVLVANPSTFLAPAAVVVSFAAFDADAVASNGGLNGLTPVVLQVYSLPSDGLLNVMIGGLTPGHTYLVYATASASAPHSCTLAPSWAAITTLAATSFTYPGIVGIRTNDVVSVPPTGGAGVTNWFITAGALPTGLVLNPATGAIEGTAPATAVGTTITVQGTGPAGSYSQTFQVMVTDLVAVSLVTGTSSAAVFAVPVLFSEPVSGLTLGSFDITPTATSGHGLPAYSVVLTGAGSSYLLTFTVTSGYSPADFAISLAHRVAGVSPPVAAASATAVYNAPVVSFSSSMPIAERIVVTATFSAPVQRATMASFSSVFSPSSNAVVPTFHVVSSTQIELHYTFTVRAATSLDVSFIGGPAGSNPPGPADSITGLLYSPATVSFSSAQPGNLFSTSPVTLTATFSTLVAGAGLDSFVVAQPLDASIQLRSVVPSTVTGTGGSGDYTVAVLTIDVLALPPAAGAVGGMNFSVGVTPSSSQHLQPSPTPTGTVVKYYPPWPVLSSSIGANGAMTRGNTVVFTATFVRGLDMAPLEVTGVRTSSWHTAFSGFIGATGVTEQVDSNVWTLTLTIVPPLAASNISVQFRPRETGISPAIVRSNGPWVVLYMPPMASLAVSAGGVAIPQYGTVPKDFKLSLTLNTLLTDGVKLQLLGMNLGAYVPAASQLLTTSTENGGSVVSVAVSVPASMYMVRMATTVAGSSATPPFSSPMDRQFSYVCNTSVSNCFTNRAVRAFHDPASSLDALALEGAPASLAGFKLSWMRLDGTAALPADITSRYLSAALFPAGAHRVAATFTRVADARHSLTLATSVQVYSVRWDSIRAGSRRLAGPPELPVASPTTLDWSGNWPADATVFVTLRNQASGDLLYSNQWPATSGSMPSDARIVLPGTTRAGLAVAKVWIVSPSLTDLPSGQQTVVLQDEMQVKLVSPFAVVVGKWRVCDVPCGDGVTTRDIWCVDAARAPAAQVSMELCVAQGLSVPATEQACHTSACEDKYWKVGVWSSCSKACGFGTQTRSVACVAADNQSPAVNCTGEQPASVRACGTTACETYEWRSFPWSNCDKDCDNDGSQSRFVTCVNSGSGAMVADSLCAAAGAKPATTQTCSGQVACVAPHWRVGDYSTCSASCGTGSAQRSVLCIHNGAVVSDSLCSGRPKPAATTPCNTTPCLTLRRGVWSECSATCGDDATSSRTLSCYRGSNRVNLFECKNAGLLPASLSFGAGQVQLIEHRDCNLAACPAPFCGATAADSPCGRNGTCIAANGTCACDVGYGGTYCQLPAGCNGVGVDVNGACCTGTLLAGRICCPSGVTSSAGVCCAAGQKLDGCGRCATPASGGAVPAVRRDLLGECCAIQSLVGGYCCSQTVDECGVCGGMNACPRTQVLNITSDVHHSIPALYSSGAVAAFLAQYRNLTGIPASVDVALQLTQIQTWNNTSTYRVTIVVSPGTTTLYPGLTTVMQQQGVRVVVLGLAAQPGSSVVALTPVCGNGVCEVGETCTPGSTDCCPYDCPAIYAMCPTSFGAAGPCSDHGSCAYESGVCSCQAGYAGAACGDCARGYQPVNGYCVPIVAPVVVVAPAGSAGTGDAAAEGGATGGAAAGGAAAAGGTVWWKSSTLILIFIIAMILLCCLLVWLCCLLCWAGPKEDELQATIAYQGNMVLVAVPQQTLGYGVTQASQQQPMMQTMYGGNMMTQNVTSQSSTMYGAKSAAAMPAPQQPVTPARQMLPPLQPTPVMDDSPVPLTRTQAAVQHSSATTTTTSSYQLPQNDSAASGLVMGDHVLKPRRSSAEERESTGSGSGAGAGAGGRTTRTTRTTTTVTRVEESSDDEEDGEDLVAMAAAMAGEDDSDEDDGNEATRVATPTR